MCSKAFIIEYERGLRVVIFTANAIYPDCNNKSQGASRRRCAQGGSWASRSHPAGGMPAQPLSATSLLPSYKSCLCPRAGLWWQDFPPRDELSPQVCHHAAPPLTSLSFCIKLLNHSCQSTCAP